MDYRALFESDYITAAVFNGREPTFTIAEVESVKLENPETGEIRGRGVIKFKEIAKKWVLNKTNAQSLAAMFGKEIEQWVGKGVTLRAEEVQVGPKKDIGIRIVGSPDIKAPIEAEIRLPKKKPRKIRLVPTGKASAKDQPAPPPANEVKP